MNQISTALHIAGVKLPPGNKRIWLWLHDHPGKTATEISKALNMPQGTVGSQLNNLKNRGMVVYTIDPGSHGQRSNVQRYSTLGRSFELLPLPLKAKAPKPVPVPVEPEPIAAVMPRAPEKSQIPPVLLGVLENYTLKELRTIRDGLNHLFEYV